MNPYVHPPLGCSSFLLQWGRDMLLSCAEQESNQRSRLGEALTVKPIGASSVSFPSYPVFKPPSPRPLPAPVVTWLRIDLWFLRRGQDPTLQRRMEAGLPLRSKSKISSSSPDKGSLWAYGSRRGGAFGRMEGGAQRLQL